MNFKFVLLWTDVALWLLFATLVGYGWRVARHENLRATWAKVLRDPAAMCSALILLLFLGVAALDSLHFRKALPPSPGQAADRVFFDNRVQSLLDLALARQIGMRESTYSEPLAYLALTKESVTRNGQVSREYPRLVHGGAHLANPARDWQADLLQRAGVGLLGGMAVAVAATLTAALLLRRRHGGVAAALGDIAGDRTHHPVRALLITFGLICLLAGPVVALMGHYHVFGTDRTGNDVLVQTLKSIRTAFVIGMLSTLATLPVAIVLGILAGYFKGWVDEVVQYLYTTLSSVPSVLLIAACVLMVQVALDKHPEWF